MIKKLCVISLIWSFSLISGVSAEISVSQSLSNHEIPFEDSVQFEIQLKWDGPQTAYFFEKPLNPYIDRMIVRGFTSSIASSFEEGQEVTTKKYKYTLIPTSSGQGIIDPVVISYVTWPDSIPGELTTEAMTVMIDDPKPKEEASGIAWYIWGGLGVGLLFIGIVASIFMFRKPKEQVVEQNPEELFLDDLELLKTKSASDKKHFQTGLHTLFREYLMRKYEFDITGMGEEEIHNSLKDTTLSDGRVEKMTKWIIQAEKDKFSPVQAAPGEVLRLESEIRQFFEHM